MKQKTKKIAAFIESLPMDVTIGNCESALLSTNMEFVGGDNGGDCINELYDQCHKAENGGNCENYNSACNKSTNRGGCLNTTLKRLQKDSGDYHKPAIPDTKPL